MPVASSRGAEHVVWGAPEISSSSECESGSAGSDLRSFDGKGRSGSRGSSRNSRRRELEGAQRHFHSLGNRQQGSEDGRRHHQVMSSVMSNATSTSTESHSPSLSRRDRKDQPPSPKFRKAEWDGFYRKMKELSKASRDSEVPADRPRAWDPTAPIEELKKLLEEDFEGVCACLEDPERAEAEETESEADATVPEGEGEWSVGSEGHAQGQCRPCHYVFAKTGCQNGRECNFCHLPHPKRFRPRPCKSKRFKCKQLAAVLDQVLDDDPDSFQNVVEQLSSQGGYLNTVVKSKLRTMAKRSAKSEARSSADTAGYPGRGSELPSQPCGASAIEAKQVLKPGLVSL